MSDQDTPFSTFVPNEMPDFGQTLPEEEPEQPPRRRGRGRPRKVPGLERIAASVKKARKKAAVHYHQHQPENPHARISASRMPALVSIYLQELADEIEQRGLQPATPELLRNWAELLDRAKN